MDVTSKIAIANGEIFRVRDVQQKKWLETVVGYRKTVMANPFSDKQQTEIAGQGLDPKAFLNIHNSLIESFIGLMSSNKNSLTAVPRKGDATKAYLWQVILADILMKSYWPKVRRKILRDQAISGIGFSLVDVPSDFDNNIYGTVVKYLDFENCRWSNTVYDPFMEDADDFMFYTMMSVKNAIVRSGMKYEPEMFDDLTLAVSTIPDSLKEAPTFKELQNAVTTGAVENQIIPWLQLYRKEWKDYIELVRYDNDKMNIVSTELIDWDGKTSPSGYVTSYFIERGRAQEEAKYITETIGKNNGIKPLKLKRVIKQVSIGGVDVGYEVLPTKHYPFTAFRFKEVEGASPIGMVDSFDGLSRSANQAFMIEFLTGIANAAVHWKAPSEVVDKDELKAEASKLIGIITTNPRSVAGTNVIADLEKLPSSNNPSTMMNIMQFLIQFCKDTTGMDDAIMGAFNGAAPSGNAIQMLQQYGGLKFRPYIEDDQMAIAHQGSVMLDFAKANSDKNAMIRIFTNDPNAVDTMQRTIGAKPLDFTSEGGHQLMEIPLNKSEGDDIINNIRNTEEDFDVVIVAAPFAETARRQALAGISMAMQQRPEIVPALLGDYMELLEIPNAKRISQKVSQSEQLQQALTECQAELKAAKSEVVNLGQQLIRAKTITSIAPLKSVFESLRNDVQLSLKSGKIDADQAQQEITKLNAAISDIEQLTGSQQSLPQTVESAVGGVQGGNS